MAAMPADQIIVGIHGVGSPAIGTVAQSIAQGWASARANHEIPTSSAMVYVGSGEQQCRYEGIEASDTKNRVKIWEVNWADLKGLPDTALGSLFYALKALIATVQLSDAGWNEHSRGVDGPLIFGALLRSYFYIVALIAPVDLFLIAYAYSASQQFIACAGILLVSLVTSILVWRLRSIDRLIVYALIPLWGGTLSSLWMIVEGRSSSERLACYCVKAMGWCEGAAGLIVLCGLIELAFKYFRFPSSTGTSTTFATRGGMLILAASLGTSAYTAVVNAIGLYALDKLSDAHLVDEKAFRAFGDLYLNKIGYNVAELELINGGTTFIIGLLFVVGLAYELWRIGASSDRSSSRRGLYIQNWLCVFLWSTFGGFFLVFFASVVDVYRVHHPANPQCKLTEVCSIYGFQWLLTSLGIHDLDVTDVYAASALRIVPFLFPVLVPSLRMLLNVGADVLLYILPPRFPLSFNKKAQARLRALLQHLRRQDPGAIISVLAHSQGTVIARDVLRQESYGIARFVAAGSPIKSLYGRFLGMSVESIPRCDWLNIYRLSDYVGGPLSCPGIKDRILKTNYAAAHFGYFEDPEVIDAVLTTAL